MNCICRIARVVLLGGGLCLASGSLSQGQEANREAAAPVVLRMPDRPDKAILTPADLRESRKVLRMDFSADGTRLSASHWGFALWDVANAKNLLSSALHEYVVAAGSANLLIRLPLKGNPATIDMLTGARRREEFAYSRKMWGTHESLRVLAPDASLVAVVLMPHPHFATGQIDKQGREIGLQPDKVIVANARTGQAMFTLNPQLLPPAGDRPIDPKENAPKTWTLAFSNDARYLAACTADGCVTVWEMSKGDQVALFRLDNDRERYELNNDHDRIYWLGAHEAVVVPAKFGFFRCDLESETAQPLEAETESAPQPETVAPKSGGGPKKKGGKAGKKKGGGAAKKAAAASAPAPATPPTSDFNRSSRGAGPDIMSVYAFSPDGRRFVQTRRTNPGRVAQQETIYLYDGHGKPLGFVPGIREDRAWSFRFSPDSQQLAIGTAKGNVLVYKVEAFDNLARQKVAIDVASP